MRITWQQVDLAFTSHFLVQFKTPDSVSWLCRFIGNQANQFSTQKLMSLHLKSCYLHKNRKLLLRNHTIHYSIAALRAIDCTELFIIWLVTVYITFLRCSRATSTGKIHIQVGNILTLPLLVRQYAKKQPNLDAYLIKIMTEAQCNISSS